jgi:histidinol-phosphatase (PHP family)
MFGHLSGLSHRLANAKVSFLILIKQVFIRMGGCFTMSDDSHGIDQIGTNYPRMLAFIHQARIQHIHYVDLDTPRADSRFPTTGFSRIAVDDLARLPFWSENQ